jgi:hypothetical protein
MDAKYALTGHDPLCTGPVGWCRSVECKHSGGEIKAVPVESLMLREPRLILNFAWALCGNYLAENRIALDIEDLIANDPPASSTVTLPHVQELEAELAAKAEQIENLERRQSGDPSSSLADADAITQPV